MVTPDDALSAASPVSRELYKELVTALGPGGPFREEAKDLYPSCARIGLRQRASSKATSPPHDKGCESRTKPQDFEGREGIKEPLAP